MSELEHSADPEAASEGNSQDGPTGAEDPYEDLTIRTGVVVEPATTLVNETGSWRERKPVIDHELCTGCGICVTYCPDRAITAVEDLEPVAEETASGNGANSGGVELVEGQNVAIDYRYCKGCEICVTECPIDAIESHPEVK